VKRATSGHRLRHSIIANCHLRAPLSTLARTQASTQPHPILRSHNEPRWSNHQAWASSEDWGRSLLQARPNAT
jgi:hypothetical protein